VSEVDSPVRSPALFSPVRRLLIPVLVASFALVAGLLAYAAGSGSAAPELDAQESAFLELLNDYRASNGKPPLIVHPQLNAAADWYATDMATQNYFGDYTYCMSNFQVGAHCDSLGRRPGERVAAFGYPGGVGENIAAGFMSAESVFDAWSRSPGHNANMLGNYRVIGIGWFCNQASRYRCYWVTDFGNVLPPVTPPPTPTPPATEAPTPTSPPEPLSWGDLDCNGTLDGGDALSVLLNSADLGASGASAGCPALGSSVMVDGDEYIWGDIDCSEGVAVADSIELLKRLADVDPASSQPDCPEPGAGL
jgi:uncharacterized protein YkwD